MNVEGYNAIVNGWPNMPRWEIRDYKEAKGCYWPIDNLIVMSSMVSQSSDIWAAVMLHEMGHATGHRSLLDRNGIRWYASKKYSDSVTTKNEPYIRMKEEAIASLISIYLCRHLDILGNTFGYHRRSLDNIIDVLRKEAKNYDAVIDNIMLHVRAGIKEITGGEMNEAKGKI